MNKDVAIKKLAELKAEAEAKCVVYNSHMTLAEFGEAAKAEEEIAQAVNEYTSIARTLAFDECAAADDPMHEACKRLTYETIKAKDEKIEDSKLTRKVIEESEKVIDLEKLHKHVGGDGIGHDKDWIYAIQKLNMLLTANKATELGLDPKVVSDTYQMKKIAREYDLGKNPASKTNLLKTLNGIIQMMLGDGYKATSHDVNFLISIYSKKNRKALTVSCANHRNFRQYIQEICYKLINGYEYELDYKKAK